MRATIIVHGVVQGVGYRFHAIEKAREYSVKGFVRNLPDGTVKVVAEGDKGLLQDFIKSLEIGPISAHVAGVDVTWEDIEPTFTEFDIRY